jgi:ribokinase
VTARIAVTGSLNMDLVVRSPRIPRPGETIIGSAYQQIPGGKGANQAVAAARLGAQVSMVGRLGRDAFGNQLLEGLAVAGIDWTFVVQDGEAPTGVALIVVDEAGQNSIVVASGANMRLCPADVNAAESAIAGSDILLLQLESPLDAVIRAAELAQRHDVTVILNPAPARPLPDRLLALIDVLIPNESETAILTGTSVESLDQAGSAAASLLQLGVGAVVLTLGDRGAMLAQESRMEVVPAFQVQAVDTTAAGDAFVSGIAVAQAEGMDLIDAVKWGNAAGALATTVHGAQPSLPTRRALEQLLASTQPGKT